MREEGCVMRVAEEEDLRKTMNISNITIEAEVLHAFSGILESILHDHTEILH
jgi:hypothetical protein